MLHVARAVAVRSALARTGRSKAFTVNGGSGLRDRPRVVRTVGMQRGPWAVRKGFTRHNCPAVSGPGMAATKRVL